MMKLQVTLDSLFLQKLLRWAGAKYDYFAFFTDNDIPYPHSGFTQQFFAGNRRVRHDDPSVSGKEMVGILSYDYKNQLENLSSENQKIIDHPEEVFFIPDIKITFNEQRITIEHPQAEKILTQINEILEENPAFQIGKIHGLTPKAEYIQNVNKIKQHITEGDVYELNYCIAFQAEIKKPDTVNLFLKLMQASPMPFSVYFKAKDQVLICASPERFLKKEAQNIIAQPIKGTIKRGANPKEDDEYKNILLHSEKERAENLMIVDLMRNDLSKISVTGSVAVEELFGIYSFQHIHQMISTISSTLKENITLTNTLRNTFPMGSMTGAPKIKCMELIERCENFKRGWFSGTAGYVNAEGDFDFNVIIRSIFIDLSTERLMFVVGSAITYDADAEMEYEECMLKAKSIFQILNAENKK